MNDDRIYNLIETIRSQIDYANHVEQYGQGDINLRNINYNLLLANYCGFYLTTCLDEYIKKDKNGEVTIELLPEMVDRMADLIAQKNNHGYKLGELSYKNSTVLIDKVRNKLAHGDFIVEGNNIIYEEKNLKGIIDIDKLVMIIGNLDYNIKNFKYYGENTFMNISNKYIVNRRIHGEPSFKKFCKDLLIFKVKEEPQNGSNRSIAYVQLFRQIEREMYDEFKKDELKTKNYDKILEKYKAQMDLYNMKITYDISSVYDLPYYEDIKKEFFEVKKAYENFDGLTISNFITDRALKYDKGEEQKHNYLNGLSFNLYILQTLRDDEKVNITNIDELHPEVENNIYLNLNNVLLALNLVGFNALYQYGLEKGLTLKGNYDFMKIVKQESFDFSKLDLELFDDPNMTIEHTFESYKDDIERYPKSIKEHEIRFEKLKDNYEKYKQHTPDEKQTKEKKLIFLKKTLEEYNKIKEINYNSMKMQEYIKTFDLDKYTKNINIIEHIRNSIAHGNVTVEATNSFDKFEEHKIHFRDFYKGKLYYEKIITVKEFASLFRMGNFSEIYNFYLNNISDDSKINTNYVSEINDRIIERKKRKI